MHCRKVSADEQSTESLSAGKVPGLQNLGCSFLSLDTDGRVVRLDSVAKASSGLKACNLQWFMLRLPQ